MYDRDCPPILREFLSYHENIKGQSPRTIAEYYLDLRMFFRFIKMIKLELPYDDSFDSIPIRDVDLELIKTVTLQDVYDFLAFLAKDRVWESQSADAGIGSAARARKLSAIKSFYKYLTVRTKQLSENPVKDLEFPKIRKSLPKYLTLEQTKELLNSVSGRNKTRDYAILMIFLTCGIRRSELAGLNVSDVYPDRIRVIGKGNKERFVFLSAACRQAISDYMEERKTIVLSDNRALFASQEKNRISTATIHHLVKKHLAAAGLDASLYSAHKLRHTAATMMLSGGVDVKTVQEVLGHENLNTTQIYTHIENTELKIAAEANPISHLFDNDQ